MITKDEYYEEVRRLERRIKAISLMMDIYEDMAIDMYRNGRLAEAQYAEEKFRNAYEAHEFRKDELARFHETHRVALCAWGEL